MKPDQALKEMRECADLWRQRYSDSLRKIERLTRERDAQADDATQNFSRANGLAIVNKVLRDEIEWLRDDLATAERALDAQTDFRAEIERLRTLLKEARDDINDDVANRYPFRETYPDDQRRYERDMDIVRRIDAALAPGADAMNHPERPLEMVLYRLARDMIAAANAIEAHGNSENAIQLRGAALMVRLWSDAVRDEAKAEPPR